MGVCSVGVFGSVGEIGDGWGAMRLGRGAGHGGTRSRMSGTLRWSSAGLSGEDLGLNVVSDSVPHMSS